MKSYARFYPKLLDRLQRATPFASRDEAVTWLRDTWVDIHQEIGADENRLKILRNARVCEEQGWRDIDKDPCYLQSPEDPPLRLFIHNDGTIVLQEIFTKQNQIIFAKPGKRPLPKQRTMERTAAPELLEMLLGK